MTTVVVAHRLSTIKDADNIIVMEKGSIKEQGNHETLMDEYPDGIYAKFVKEQLKSALAIQSAGLSPGLSPGLSSRLSPGLSSSKLSQGLSPGLSPGINTV